MARKYFQSRVVESRNLCSNVKHIVFEPQQDEPFEYIPGQFVMIHFPNEAGLELNRSYSISSIPGECKGYALCVKRVDFGKGSTLLHSLEVGQEIKTSGPFGRFTLREEQPKDIILAATGTGIAPFRSMLDQLKAAMDQTTRVHVLMGVRHTNELLYHDELTQLAADNPNFTYRPCVSRPAPEDNWEGRVGYVGSFLDDLEAEGSLVPGDTVAYLCGVPPMIDGMRNSFKERGFDRRAIRTEKFASPPDPVPKSATPKAAPAFKPKFLKKAKK